MTMGDGAGWTATAGLSARTGSSGGVESKSDVASKPRISPLGSANQPLHRPAETARPRICRTRDAGWEDDGNGGASPCHSHKPDSWLSVLIGRHRVMMTYR